MRCVLGCLVTRTCLWHTTSLMQLLLCVQGAKYESALQGGTSQNPPRCLGMACASAQAAAGLPRQVSQPRTAGLRAAPRIHLNALTQDRAAAQRPQAAPLPTSWLHTAPGSSGSSRKQRPPRRGRPQLTSHLGALGHSLRRTVNRGQGKQAIPRQPQQMRALAGCPAAPLGATTTTQPRAHHARVQTYQPGSSQI
jgi:hypothetical protein